MTRAPRADPIELEVTTQLCGKEAHALGPKVNLDECLNLVLRIRVYEARVGHDDAASNGLAGAPIELPLNEAVAHLASAPLERERDLRRREAVLQQEWPARAAFARRKPRAE